MTVYRDNETIRLINSLGDASLDKFDDRLRLQKVAYLVQKLGSSGGFTFSWYRRGPYSPSLTQALYQCEESGELCQEQKLSLEEKDILKKIMSLIGKNGLNEPKTLELYASVWYLLPVWKVTKDTIEYVFRKFKEEKPGYNKSEIKKAIEKILKFRNQVIE